MGRLTWEPTRQAGQAGRPDRQVRQAAQAGEAGQAGQAGRPGGQARQTIQAGSQVQSKTHRVFTIKPKPMACLTWECGVWKVPKQNAWAKRNSKQSAPDLLHLDRHGFPEQRFLKKNQGPKP